VFPERWRVPLTSSSRPQSFVQWAVSGIFPRGPGEMIGEIQLQMQDFLNVSSLLWEGGGRCSCFSLWTPVTESNICLSAAVVPNRYRAWKPA